MQLSIRGDDREHSIIKTPHHPGLVKPLSFHSLQPAFATHLPENGTDLRYIPELLGHKSSRTTEIYTHVSTLKVSNITSPFDTLQGGKEE